MNTTKLKHAVRALVCSAALAAPAFSQPAAAPTLTALQSVEAGQWQLRAVGGQTRSICLSDPRALLQLQHIGATCSRFVIANDAKQSTVHYTCPGAGHGRTTVRVETPRLVQIDSQGVAQNEPFSMVWEGRRVGQCGTRVGLLKR
jgi:hypothetical protein